MLVIHDIFEEDIEFCEKVGIEHRVFKFTNFRGDFSRLNQASTDNIFRGSIAATRYIQHMTTWKIFYDKYSFNCSEFYSSLREYLLNSNCIMMPYGLLCPRSETIHNALGDDLFIRPNSGAKPFVGMRVNDWSKFHSQMRFECVAQNEMCVISKTKRIGAEFRFVIAGDRILGASSYMFDGEPNEKIKPYKPVYDYVEGVIKNFEFGYPVYVLDVGEIIDQGNIYFKVVEINSFTCSGLYNCDRAKIFSEVQEIVRKENEEN